MSELGGKPKKPYQYLIRESSETFLEDPRWYQVQNGIRLAHHFFKNLPDQFWLVKAEESPDDVDRRVIIPGFTTVCFLLR